MAMCLVVTLTLLPESFCVCVLSRMFAVPEKWLCYSGEVSCFLVTCLCTCAMYRWCYLSPVAL
jgi:hypothetical protein